MLLDAARWRQEQRLRLAVMTAWQAARLNNSKKIPPLSKLLPNVDEDSGMTPEKSRILWLDWAAAHEKDGVRVTRLVEK